MTFKERSNARTDTSLKDIFGNEFKVGDDVVRAMVLGRVPGLELGKITRIEDGKMYMNNAKVAIRYPGRLMIINKLRQ